MSIVARSGALDYLDRLPARSSFKPPSASILGIVATCCLIGIAIWMYVPLVDSTLKGDYFQSELQLRIYANQKVNVPFDLKMAVVFRNKTSGAVADHKLLLDELKINSYHRSSSLITIVSSVEECDRDYFKNAANSMQLEDCFTFPNNVSLQMLSDQMFTTYYGFKISYDCSDPFGCGDALSSTLDKKTAFFLSAFTNFTPSFYFATKQLQEDGSFQYETYRIESSDYNTPVTVASTFIGTLDTLQTNVDSSILPWRNYRTQKSLRWTGQQVGEGTSPDSFVNQIQISLASSYYQAQIYRFYRKVDWMLAMVGGGVFLLYLFFWLACHCINQTLSRMRLPEELLVQCRSPLSNNLPQRVTMSFRYLLTRFLPCSQSAFMDQVMRSIDIVSLIKKIKTSERNIKEKQIAVYNKERRAIFSPNQYQYHKQIQNQQENNKARDQASLNQGIIIRQEASSAYLPLQDNQLQLTPRGQQIAQTLNLHPQVAQALKKQPQVLRLISCSSSILLLSQTQLNSDQQDQPGVQDRQKEMLNRIEQIQEDNHFDRKTLQRRKTKTQVCLQNFSKMIKKLDIFAVKPNFNAFPARVSLFGCLLTLLIVILTFLTIISSLITINQPNLIISKEIKQPKDVKYSVTTGEGFRPVICLSSSDKDRITSGQVRLRFFKQSRGQKKYIEAILMGEFQESLLGITQKMLQYNMILTENCFRMPDGENLQMGGHLTDHEAFFGIQMEGICTGTPAFCESVLSTTNGYLRSVLTSSTPPRMFLPNNEYVPTSKTISQNGAVRVSLRDIDRFASTLISDIEEVIYVDQLQVRDSFTKRLLAQQPPITHRGIRIDKRLDNQLTSSSRDSLATYTIKIKPSGKTTVIYLTTIGLQTLLAMFGGIAFFWYLIIHIFAKLYNQFNVKMQLADSLYYEQLYNQQGFCSKCCSLSKIPICCIPSCLSFKQSVQRMRLFQQKIGYDLNYIQLIKDIQSCWLLSVAGYPTTQAKDLALIYFKQTLRQSYEQQQVLTSQDDVQFMADQYQSNSFAQSQQRLSHQSNNQVVNINPLLAATSFQNTAPLINIQNQIQKQRKNIQDNLDEIPAYDQYKTVNKGIFLQKLACFDWFHSSPEFTLNGQWRVRSFFGVFCFLLMIMFCLLLLVYSFSGYDLNRNARIGFKQYMQFQHYSDISLNRQNSRIAVGFYRFANYSFENVSHLLTAPNANIQLSLYDQTVTRKQSGNLVSSATKHSLVACPPNYFSGFQNNNIDNSFADYEKNLKNAYCIEDVDLMLSKSADTLRYFSLRIQNKNSSSSYSNIWSDFTNKYLIGIITAVPVPDTTQKRFGYQLYPLKPQLTLVGWQRQINITLTKQRMKFMENNQEKVLQTFNYVENRENERNQQNNGKYQTLTVMFTYQGLVQEYSIQESSIAVIFGLVGGNLLFFMTILGACATGFNNFKMRYQVGKQLYRVAVIQVKKNKGKGSNKGTKGKDKKLQNDPQDQEDEEKMEIEDTEYWQLTLLFAYFLSFLAGILNNYQLTDSLKNIHILQSYADVDLNLFLFMQRLRTIKDTLNEQYKLHSNPSVPTTNIFGKQLAVSGQTPYTLHSKQVSLSQIASHGLTSYDQFKIHSAEEAQISLQDVFESNYLKRNLILRNNNPNKQQSKQVPFKKKGQSGFQRQFQRQRQNGNRLNRQNRRTVQKQSQRKDFLNNSRRALNQQQRQEIKVEAQNTAQKLTRKEEKSQGTEVRASFSRNIENVLQLADSNKQSGQYSQKDKQKNALQLIIKNSQVDVQGFDEDQEEEPSDT